VKGAFRRFGMGNVMGKNQAYGDYLVVSMIFGGARLRQKPIRTCPLPFK
jgi:hypothetical protein